MALQTPFANSGDRKPISQSQSADGSVSWEKGFTSLYALAPQDGGKFIDRQEFNQIVYEISEATIENSQAIAELIDDENISTAKTWSSNKINADIQNIETQITTQGSKLLTANVTKSVGASGADFATLKEALEWCLQYSPNQKYTITLNCNADMPVPGDLSSLNGNLEFVTIDANNNTYSSAAVFLNLRFLSLKSIQNFIINSSYVSHSIVLQDLKCELNSITINSSAGYMLFTRRAVTTIKSCHFNYTGNTAVAEICDIGELSTCCVISSSFSSPNAVVTNCFDSIASSIVFIDNSSSISGRFTRHINCRSGSIYTNASNNFTIFNITKNTLTSSGIIMSV